ncbi:hypothetical protein ACSBR2_026161 [Camellia fascicularis]
MDVLIKEPVLLNKDAMDDDAVENLDEEVSESESEDKDVKLTEPSKNSIYKRDGLLDKLADVGWPKNVEWLHTLYLDIDQQQEVDVNDDLARELAFYTQALEEKRTIEEAEEWRKAREAKKIAKEGQAQKLKETAKQKKEEIESVKKWRKQRQQSGFAGDDKDGEIGLSFEDGKSFERSNKKGPGVGPGDCSGGKARQGGGKVMKGAGGKGKSRGFKDSKFGFGGRKGMKKQNTAETTNDARGFDKTKRNLCY